MKLLFIPNWNGHLYLQEYFDNSVTKIYNKINFQNKEILELEKNNITKTNEIIETKLKEELNKNKEERLMAITGDHSNSFSLIKAFRSKNPDFKLIIFDAHPDVEKSSDLPSHEDYLRNLIDKDIIKPENIYLFGIRTFSRVEFDYLIEKSINFWTIVDILRNKKEIKRILEGIVKKSNSLYLSIDIDVLDPDIAPGTYYREWCGLNLEELKEFISIIKEKARIIDITEFYSEKDEENKTLNLVLDLIQFLININ